MLTINITPTSLYFKDLSDELQRDIQNKFSITFRFEKGKLAITEPPEKLYKTLYLLSTTYDIELI